LTITGDRAPYEMRMDGKVEKHAVEPGQVNRTGAPTTRVDVVHL
jgi:hypothetical protein